MVFLKPTIMRDSDSSSRLSLDRYDLIRANQKDAQPASNPFLPLKDSPVIPPMRAPSEPAAAAAPAAPASGASAP